MEEKRVLIPIANGTCEYQAIALLTALSKCGITAKLATINGDENLFTEMTYCTVRSCGFFSYSVVTKFI